MYAFTKKPETDLAHGAVYTPLHPEHGAEFVGYNQDGTEEWTIDGVIAPDALERLFDTDAAIVAYYQIAPLRLADED
jgi:hypothetical protein